MKHRILIVDDDADIASQLSVLLGRRYDTAVASNGFEALRRLDEAAADVVLLDLRMPGLNGSGFVDELRRRGQDTRIILISANPDVAAQAEQLGAVGWLAKPFDIETLEARIEQALPS